MSIIAELKRRNVFRVAAAFLVAGWLLIEMSSVALEAFGAPGWVPKSVGILLALGFPVALFFAWAYEVTPEGIKRESEVDRSKSITHETGRRLDLMTMALLVLAIALFLSESLWRSPPESTSTPAEPATATPDEREVSLAVLPFTNMSTDAENEYFADGISEEILSLLADVRDLSVASRTSAFAYKGSNASIPEIANALGVRYVLEGSVRKAGNQVRITAQLIDAVSDRHLWADTYDRTLEDIFAIQDEIAAAIGQALQVQLLGDGGAQLKSEALDPQIYALFLEARHLLRRRSREDMQAATEMLIRVVEAEPGFGRGHAVLGEAYLLSGWGDLLPNDVAQSQARMHAEMARSLDPKLGGVDLVLGHIAEDQPDRVAALNHYNRAVELEPSEPRPYHWRGIFYAEAGFHEECRADLETAVELEPRNPNVHFALAGCLRSSGDLDGAVAAARGAMTLNRSGWLNAVAHVEILRGNLDAAADAIKRNVEQKESRPEYWAELLRQIGHPADPTEVSLSGDVEDPLRTSPAVLAMLGRTDEYLDIVRNIENPRPGILSVSWLNQFAEMRRDPRFLEIMERNGILDLWRYMGPPPDCRTEAVGFSCGHGGDELEEDTSP